MVNFALSTYIISPCVRIAHTTPETLGKLERNLYT